MLLECLCPPDRFLITRSFVNEDLHSEGFKQVSRFTDIEGIEWDEYLKCMPLIADSNPPIPYDTLNWKIFVAVFDDGTALLHGTLLDGYPILVENEREWDRTLPKLLPRRFGTTCMDEVD
jgi:hypothetical protein